MAAKYNSLSSVLPSAQAAELSVCSAQKRICVFPSLGILTQRLDVPQISEHQALAWG